MANKKSILTHTITESVKNFAATLETERSDREMTQKEMAETLNISLSSYRRIVSGESTTVPMEMIINTHRLTGMWLYQMLGESTEDTKVLDRYMLLDEEDQEIVRTLVYQLWKRKECYGKET